MKNKHMIRTLTVLLTVMLCMTAFSTVAFASGGDTAPTSEAQTDRLTARISPGTIFPN